MCQSSQPLNDSWQYLLWKEQYRDSNDNISQYLHIFYVQGTLLKVHMYHLTDCWQSHHDNNDSVYIIQRPSS